jgi:hypothetical protein
MTHEYEHGTGFPQSNASSCCFFQHVSKLAYTWRGLSITKRGPGACKYVAGITCNMHTGLAQTVQKKKKNYAGIE